VDITPTELRQRLADGKVYLPETARTAADNFFKPENLTALRELAMRRAAQAVDDQLVAELRQRGAEGPWAAGERILVLVGGDSTAAALVRTGRRLSDMMMDAPWTVAHVDRPNRAAPGAEATRCLTEALKLTEQLGGAVVTLTGDDLVTTVLDYAHRSNVTQIVVGKRPGRRSWRHRFSGQLAPALLREAQGAALHVVTDAPAAAPRPQPARPAARVDAAGQLFALGAVAVANGVPALLDRTAADAKLALVFLLGVLATGLRSGLWPAVTAAAGGALSYNFFFLDPRLTFEIGRATDVLTFATFFVVALATGWLTGRVRDQARATSRRAAAEPLLPPKRRDTYAENLERALSEGTPGADAIRRALAEQPARAMMQP
jgi:two-component system sensor histidine kinase KdpD